MAARSQEIYPRNSNLRSQHSKLQPAHFNTARTCDVKTSGASAKCQIARGFHVHVTHGQTQTSGTTNIIKNPGFPGFLVFESKVVGQPRPGSHPKKMGGPSGSDYVCGQKYDVTDNFLAARCAQTVFFWSRPPVETTFPAIVEHFLPKS